MFVCLGTCTLDVTANAVIIYVVTMPRRDSPPSRAVSPVPRATEGAYKPAVTPALASRPQWDWRRSYSSARSGGRVDLSSISVQVHEEIAFDEADEEVAPSASRLPKPPDRIRSAGSTRSFVREAPANSPSWTGRRPLSVGASSEAESGSDHSKGYQPVCSDLC